MRSRLCGGGDGGAAVGCIWDCRCALQFRISTGMGCS